MAQTLDIHQYDGKVDKQVYEFIKFFERESNIQQNEKSDIVQKFIIEIYNSACDNSKNKSNYSPSLIHSIAKAYSLNEYDRLNMTDIHSPFIVAWLLCKKFKEEDLFFLHLYDMHITNGYCPSGRTIRCLQIISVLMNG